MYEKDKSTIVNDARLDMFPQIYQKKKKNKKNQRINAPKTLDGSSILPCFQLLQEKIKGRTYISKFWMFSSLSYPSPLSPLGYRWELKTSRKYTWSTNLEVQRRKFREEIRHCYWRFARWYWWSQRWKRSDIPISS